MEKLEFKCKDYGSECNKVNKVKTCPYLGPSFMRYTNNKLTKLKSYYLCVKK